MITCGNGHHKLQLFLAKILHDMNTTYLDVREHDPLVPIYLYCWFLLEYNQGVGALRTRAQERAIHSSPSIVGVLLEYCWSIVGVDYPVHAKFLSEKDMICYVYLESCRAVATLNP